MPIKHYYNIVTDGDGRITNFTNGILFNSIEMPECYLIDLLVPGLCKDEVTVYQNGNTIMVKKNPRKNPYEKYDYIDINIGIERTVGEITFVFDEIEKIKTKLKDGILRIIAPRINKFVKIEPDE